MRVFVIYESFMQNTSDPAMMDITFRAPQMDGPREFGSTVSVPTDASPREIEKAVVAAVITSAAADTVTVRGRDIVMPSLQQG